MFSSLRNDFKAHSGEHAVVLVDDRREFINQLGGSVRPLLHLPVSQQQLRKAMLGLLDVRLPELAIPGFSDEIGDHAGQAELIDQWPVNFAVAESFKRQACAQHETGRPLTRHR